MSKELNRKEFGASNEYWKLFSADIDGDRSDNSRRGISDTLAVRADSMANCDVKLNSVTDNKDKHGERWSWSNSVVATVHQYSLPAGGQQ